MNDSTARNTSATVISRGDHGISRKQIAKSALKVLYRLHDAGFRACLVGGAVRDLLLSGKPKDFDIATDALPEDVHALFRNSRLIGRRFRLVHVRFGREIIEVATFRASGSGDEAAALSNDAGRILRDNVYGAIDEDVWRRDFTANALYYDIADFTVIDFVGGMADIDARVLRLIGNAEKRLREDPVRMLRAVRFAAKLDFDIAEDVRVATKLLAPNLSDVPAARLFDEFQKLFQSGFAAEVFPLLDEFGLFAVMFPDAASALDADDGAQTRAFVERALHNTDQRIKGGKSVTPMFLLGVFLWSGVQRRAADLRSKDKLSEAQSLSLAAQELVLRAQSRVSIPKRFSIPMRDMLALQPRFEILKGRRAWSLLEHRRFRAAYDFYVLRAEIGQADPEKAKFWTDIQLLSVAARRERLGMPADGGGRAPKKRRRRRRRSKSEQ